MRMSRGFVVLMGHVCMSVSIRDDCCVTYVTHAHVYLCFCYVTYLLCFCIVLLCSRMFATHVSHSLFVYVYYHGITDVKYTKNAQVRVSPSPPTLGNR